MSTARKGTRVPATNTPRAPSPPILRRCAALARDTLLVALALVVADPEMAAVLLMIALLFGATIALMLLGLI